MRRLIGLVAILVAASVAAADGDALATALRSGTAGIEVRARFEQVDQEGFDDDAQATTTRLRLNYKTGQWKNWSGFVEFDHVFNVLLTDYDSGAGTSPGKAGEYPVIADPDGSDLNQLYLDYSSDPNWKWRFGRQRILLDNQRFVGGVGWRHNELSGRRRADGRLQTRRHGTGICSAGTVRHFARVGRQHPCDRMHFFALQLALVAEYHLDLVDRQARSLRHGGAREPGGLEPLVEPVMVEEDSHGPNSARDRGKRQTMSGRISCPDPHPR
jgi:hypothetical protein